MRPGGHWVHRVSLDSPARALRVIAFIGGRWVHPRALWIVGLIQGLWVPARTYSGHSVHPGSLGSLVRALGVVVFILGRWVLSHMPWWSFGSSWVVGFISARPGVV